MANSHHLMVNFVLASSLGVFLFILATRMKISAIVVLLLGGILAGPEFFGFVHPEELGGGLNTIISLAVGLILFEGGLTLDIRGYRQVSKEIWGVLTKGVLVTWLVTAVLVKFIFNFGWELSILSSSLIIVTGPTVIGPLLKRIRVKKNIHNILHWEGVLIDPIGVFIALLCYEWIISADASQGAVTLNFLSRFFVGAVVGIVAGIVIYQVLKRNWIPEKTLNIFVLACAMLTFMVADHIVTESGLLSVTIAGFLIGTKKPPSLSAIIAYKDELKDFLIGLLFILLAAQLELGKFVAYGAGLIAIVLLVMFLVRPLNIFISTFGSKLSLKEKVFLSWIAPRGIVAASMASLFAFRLEEAGMQNADFLETMTYSVIAGTVFFQGFTARWVGKILGVLEPEAKDWLIVGAHRLGRQVAKFVIGQGHSVILIDTNPREIKLAHREGFTAINANAMTIDPGKNVQFYGIGNVLAITENEDLNQLVCQRWGKLLDHPNLFRWAPANRETEDEVIGKIAVGEQVWQRFHLKRLMAAEPGQDQVDLRTVTVNAQAAQKMGSILMHSADGSVRPDHPDEKVEGEITVLTFQDDAPHTEFPISEKDVYLGSQGSLEDLYREMLQSLSQDISTEEIDRIHGDLLDREAEFTSLIGYGIALPHTYSSAVSSTRLMAAKVEPPLPCQHTGEDISLVFLLLSPVNQPVEHLNMISRIAKFVMKEEQRKAILSAETPEALYRIISES